MSDLWREHVTAALLGTQRRQPPSLTGAPPGAGDPAGRLLDQAAVLAVRRRAGRRPGTAEPIAPAPAESAPIVPPAAAGRLRRILDGDRIRVLPEWLAEAARQGYRVPPRLLPDLLDRGRADRSLRPHIARAAGRRGVWLAMRNVDWAYLVLASGGEAAEDPEVWDTGVRAQRVAHLTRLRTTDPAAAVSTLRRTWATEPASDRALFLATFETGLGPGDEEFLESALDDRGQDVRRIAADLLARLAASAYARRMTDRARACVRAERTPADRSPAQRIIVDLPEDHDDAMQRDGIPYHAAERVGTRTGWLREILARTPLPVWTEVFDTDPSGLVHLPVADVAGHDAPIAKDVHLGWARATIRQRDAWWARALLAYGVLSDEVDVLAALLDVLSGGERDAAAAGLIRRTGGRADLLRLLDRTPGPWTGELADAVVAALMAAAEGTGDERFLAELCRLAGEHLTPDVAPRLDEPARRHAGSWRPAAGLDDLADTLRFRHDMLEELR